jgi:hypothetical protein
LVCAILPDAGHPAGRKKGMAEMLDMGINSDNTGIFACC